MALLEEQFTETLQAGAPDITYQGNEGQEQKIARELWDQLPPEAQHNLEIFNSSFQVEPGNKFYRCCNNRCNNKPLNKWPKVLNKWRHNLNKV